MDFAYWSVVFILIYVVLNIKIAVVATTFSYRLGIKKGFPWIAGLLGLIFGIVGIIVVALFPNRRKICANCDHAMTLHMDACPQCNTAHPQRSSLPTNNAHSTMSVASRWVKLSAIILTAFLFLLVLLSLYVFVTPSSAISPDSILNPMLFLPELNNSIASIFLC